jgi:hypothetical protein
MKRGPVCSVCIHPKRAALEALRPGAPSDRKAAAMGVSRAALARHRKHAAASGPTGPKKETLPPPAPTSERDALLDALARLRGSLAKAEADDLPRIAKALTELGKRLQSLDEDREVTQEQIVKSKAWQELLGRLEVALRPYPDAARAMARALAGSS